MIRLILVSTLLVGCAGPVKSNKDQTDAQFIEQGKRDVEEMKRITERGLSK
jgi:PBP1b-binding outer membrane lipoprotein LpoB